ncbi:Integrase core domain containing protein [Pyrenophora tritici-repentis]|uniref:Integrase core domain containing protein n=1 Tax=Pyrenophora tritici-repentis TaxID=45151 RepID=A0A922N1S7_9PLEO|nr:Integrase core domain containing protein [Pyrenophora tritici-repentis]
MPSETSSAQSEEPVSILMAEPGQPAARDSYRQYLGKLEPHDVHAPRFDGENISEFLDEYDFEADRVGWPEELRKKQLPYFCTQKYKAFIRKLPSYYGIESYQEYKEELRELYAGQDEFRQRGTRAFIENYVKEVQRRQPAVRIVEYYQNFVTYFAAAESRGQVAKLEKGHFFFRGLAIEDMERVMHHMPKDDRPRLDDVTSFKIEKIYQFVREHQAQEEGLSALYSDYSSTSRRLARRDAGVVEESIPTFKRPSEAPRQSVPGILPIAAQPDKAAAPKVDQAVEDLIQRFQGLSMTIEQFNEMAEGNIGIRRLFAKPENYAEAYKQLVLRPHRVSTEILERNDGSFKSIYPPIVNPQAGVHYAGNREPQRARCRCCGREGHIIANCPDQNLLKSNRWCHTRSEEQPNGWKQVRYYFGPYPTDIWGMFPGGGIAPKPFGSEVLEWLLQSLKERFKVTDDQLKRPMQEVLPNWFDAAGRPIKVEKTGNSGESYTVESSEEAELMARQTMALRSAAQFLETVSCRVLHPEDDSEVNAIDGRTKAGRLAKEQREREARLGKKPGMPRMKSSRTASSYEDMDVEEEPEVLRHRAQVEIDDSQVPETQVQQRLDTPISNGTRERDSRSATVDHDVIPAPAPVPKASRAFAPVTIPTTEDLAAMAQNTAPTVLAKAMLNQEVRGIRQLDLLASPEVAAAVTKALEEARRPRVHFQVDETRSGETMEIQQANNNKSDDEKADSDEDGSIEEAVQRLYDWGSGDTCVVETESSQPEVITKGILTQLCPKMDRSRKIDRVGVGEANELHDFQNYEISDEEDGYVEAQSRMPSEARLKGELQQQRYSVKGQLPTCWVSLHGGMGRALIDTGSQLNVMRLSTARALNVYITELDQSGLPPELQQGMITADGGMDPFRVADKVKPVDIPREDAPMDLGRKDWKERAIARQAARIALRGPDISPFDHLFYVRTATFPRGHRLNPERLRKMNIGEDLRPNEVHLIQQLMFQREDALAWEFQHMSQIHEDVQPPYKIRTIPHTAWQEKNFPLPKKLVPIVNAMYRNKYFLVPKIERPVKPEDFRFINNAVRYNAVTLRDAYIPPSADEFSERFANRRTYALFDLFSGYDQIPLHTSSRDMTAFQTPNGLYRQCTLPMGATNSVAVFVRAVMKILHDHLPETAPFVDDIVVAGPRDDYGGEEAFDGVRRFVLEHALQMDKVLTDIARAEATVSGKKSWWGVPRMAIVGYEVDKNGRHPAKDKVRKILEWPECRTVKEVRQFVGIVVYYRQWIFCFSLKAEPLFVLLRKDARWIWGDEQRHAMKILKEAITSPPALVAINYRGGLLIVGVDASVRGAGAHLEQVGPDGRRHTIRFESTLWSEAESKLHSTKLECKTLVWALKVFQVHLYGHPFRVETDAKVLIAQLNRSSPDLPGSVMNRWLATILQWEFEIVHVPGKKNVIPDALSRYPQPEGWTPPKEDEDDLEPFIDRVLNRYEETNLVMATEETIGKLLTEEYDEKSEEIAVFLRTLKRPDGLRGQERRKWTKNAARFFVRDRHLFRKATKAMPVRRVVDGEDLQAALIQEIHERLGHKGIQTTFGAVCQRYWWDGMYRQVAKQLGPCKVCQTMRGTRKEAELNSTYSRAMWSWWTVDITHMPRVRGRTYLLVAREYLSGWPETRALSTASSDSVAKFIFEEICCRWGVPERISVDGGTENKSVVQSLATLFGIQRVQASAYNSRAQGLIERGHQGFIHGLAKMPGLWIDNLSAITWAERVSLRRPLGFSPAQLVLGQNPVLPIELVVPTWQSLPWNEVRSHADLLAVRATQLQFRRENLEEAVQRTRRLRREAVESRNAKKDVPKPFQVGDLVLVWDAIKSIDKSSDRKLDDRWRGPYRVREAQADKGYYRLEDLNEVAFPNTTRADRLKKFEELPEELEDSLLRGRLRLYPETERLPMARPTAPRQRQATPRADQTRDVQAGEDREGEQDRRTIVGGINRGNIVEGSRRGGQSRRLRIARGDSDTE